ARQPDDLPELVRPAAAEDGHRFHYRGVDASGRPVHDDAAIDLDSRYRLVRLGRARHGLERATLEHDCLQPALTRALGCFDRADGTLEVIGVRVDVEIDHPCCHLVLRARGRSRLGGGGGRVGAGRCCAGRRELQETPPRDRIETHHAPPCGSDGRVNALRPAGKDVTAATAAENGAAEGFPALRIYKEGPPGRVCATNPAATTHDHECQIRWAPTN